ncbi:MAG: PilZ domain-containing protein [Deltaproteobacteria bacterium]|nr:PilZ domain-containing protein [Deltaproteobacteria bacterium]
MDHKSRDEDLGAGIRSLDIVSEGKTFLPPWMFRHEDLIKALEGAQVLEKRKLINALNYLHFMEGHLYALFQHDHYNEGILIEALPEPCLDDRIVCRWADRYSTFNLKQFQFRYLVIKTNESILLAPAVLLEEGIDGFTVQLPDESFVLSRRQVVRFPCSDTSVELIQSGFVATGRLVDFSPLAFRVSVKPENSSSIWFNPDVPATVQLSSDGKILFSGPCQCSRQTQDLFSWEIVLKPQDTLIARYQPVIFRSNRQQVAPMPLIQFEHPFFKKQIQREIQNISHSGFSVYEKAEEGVLMPGMILPSLMIAFAGILKMTVKAQVIRRQEENGQVLCGLAILDMDLDQYRTLSQILGYVEDPHTYVANKVDMDALWEFLFDTGFIYPKKYRHLQSYRGNFKETYRKLYQDCPEITQHFTYEKNGRIYAHLSIIRAYQKAWLGHHWAARRMDGQKTGYLLLQHGANYLTGLARLPSANMDYLMTYFRPDNPFPYMLFGDTTKAYNNPRHCSADVFAYRPYERPERPGLLPGAWTLRESRPTDLWELDLFYRHRSGGLMLDAFHIGALGKGVEPLSEVYERLGFNREMNVLSLLQDDHLKAVFIVDRSDLGINLSELLNSIKIMVIDSENTPWEILSAAVDQIAVQYPVEEIPVLIYPEDYAEARQIPHERQYMLWIISVRDNKGYIEFLQKQYGISLKT